AGTYNGRGLGAGPRRRYPGNQGRNPRNCRHSRRQQVRQARCIAHDHRPQEHAGARSWYRRNGVAATGDRDLVGPRRRNRRARRSDRPALYDARRQWRYRCAAGANRQTPSVDGERGHPARTRRSPWRGSRVRVARSARQARAQSPFGSAAPARRVAFRRDDMNETFRPALASDACARLEAQVKTWEQGEVARFIAKAPERQAQFTTLGWFPVKRTDTALGILHTPLG